MGQLNPGTLHYIRGNTFWDVRPSYHNTSNIWRSILSIRDVLKRGKLDRSIRRESDLRFWLIRNPGPVDGKCGNQSFILEKRTLTRSRSGSNLPFVSLFGKESTGKIHYITSVNLLRRGDHFTGMVSGTALASASQWTWKATGLNQPAKSTERKESCRPLPSRTMT
ncbi:conserved hypothetical protein [Ricinus communis]|uniref:Uncharacterized protein n=1 Tax=Ricinus communis TaxID=3988 RepID=B9T993_RICCO|nr:conserved hypothetical protein [Ricinus communis]